MNNQSNYSSDEGKIDKVNQEKAVYKNSSGMNALVHLSPLLMTFVSAGTSSFSNVIPMGIGVWLSPVLAWLLPALAPLILWFSLKENHPSVEKHAKKALNFQITVITWWLALVALVAGAVAFSAMTEDPSRTLRVIVEEVGTMTIPLLFILGILALFILLMPIIKAIKANGGEPATNYPLAREFFKTDRVSSRIGDD